MNTRKDRELNERLDQIGRELIRAFSIKADELETATTSPWLFARLRARIAAERERSETTERWSILLTVLKRAVPATAAAAALALGVFLFASSDNSQASAAFTDQALFETNDVGVQHIVFAERRPLSHDELLDAIINGEREGAR